MAQPGGVLQSDPTAGLRRVDPGYEDVSPLGTSLRVPTLDLRHPTDFSGVYRAPEHVGEGFFVRFAGGVAAVFRASDYIDVGGLGIPVVAPDTKYYIGGLPSAPRAVEPTAQARRMRPEPSRVSPRPEPRGVNPVQESGTPEPGDGSMFEDEVYRRARLAALIGGG